MKYFSFTATLAVVLPPKNPSLFVKSFAPLHRQRLKHPFSPSALAVSYPRQGEKCPESAQSSCDPFHLKCDKRLSLGDDCPNKQEEGLASSASSTRSQPNALLSRRSVLVASAAALTLLPLASASASTSSSSPNQHPDQRLEELSFGNAEWNDAALLDDPAPPIDARIVPPSFATYLARFLLKYDDGASIWWRDLSESYSLLASYDTRKREGKAFGSFAYSIQKGVYDFVTGEDGGSSEVSIREKYVALFHMLLEKYNSKEDAVRHIAFLFATLPSKYQPTQAISEKCGVAIIKENMASSTNDKNGRASSLSPDFQEDLTSLLPQNYKLSYNESKKSFTIIPRLNLFEIGVNDESGPTAIATAFGPLSSLPLSRERPNLAFDYYALLGVSGGAGCSLTHTLVIPLDVVKTRIQTNPGEYEGIWDGALTISKKEGLGALLLGTQATIAGYLWYGISVYPCYSLFKRMIGEDLLSPAFAIANANNIALVAGALASVVASLGLTPIEAARIRAVAEPDIYKKMGLLGTLKVIGSEDDDLGWRNLYAGLPSLMTRQVIFGSVKFLAFERASEAIFTIWPGLRDATYTALGVSLVAGGISGALSSVVSQPADSVLTYVARQSTGGSLGILEGAKTMVQDEGLGSLFRGLGSRCVWAGFIIAGQFLLYDVFRSIFGIGSNNLNQVYEIVLPVQ